MPTILLAALGGAIGASLRYIVNQTFVRFGNGASAIDGIAVFPWATMTVNVAGGLLMGIVTVVIGEKLGGSPEWRTFLATGILGGFTTFSAFSADMLTLYLSDGALGPRLIAYVFGSVTLAFLALVAGMWITRSVLA